MASVAAGQAEVAFGLISEIVPAPGVQLAGPFPPNSKGRSLCLPESPVRQRTAKSLEKSFSR